MGNLNNALIGLAVFLMAIAIVCSFPLTSNWNQNQISKIKKESSFCFAVISNTNNNIEAYSNLANSINTNCSFLIIDGNFVHYSTNEEYYLALSQMKQLNTPTIAAMGVHEITSGNKLIFEEMFGRTYFSFNVSDNLFVVLDNSLGFIDAQQYKWLSNELNKDYKNKIVIMHLPLFLSANKSYMPNSSNIENLFTENGVRMVVSTHDSKYSKFSREGIDYIVVGNEKGATKDDLTYARVYINNGVLSTNKVIFDRETPSEQFLNTSIWPSIIFGYKIVIIGIICYLGLEFLKKQKH